MSLEAKAAFPAEHPRCGLCARPSVQVGHDHFPYEVRGALGRQCNSRLGSLEAALRLPAGRPLPRVGPTAEHQLEQAALGNGLVELAYLHRLPDLLVRHRSASASAARSRGRLPCDVAQRDGHRGPRRSHRRMCSLAATRRRPGSAGLPRNRRPLGQDPEPGLEVGHGNGSAATRPPSRYHQPDDR
ncbi:endonuclease domain-containing protein [Kitasatospora sp. NPDC059648]|uniref:endonuclease domain-containing protein n=1 Tax=Kitasatospora sp. NPDC059648 TaxID=3346894 RepID=UPI003695CE2C